LKYSNLKVQKSMAAKEIYPLPPTSPGLRNAGVSHVINRILFTIDTQLDREVLST